MYSLLLEKVAGSPQPVCSPAGDKKICGACHKTKPVTEFSRKNGYSDGYQNECKECRRKEARTRAAKKKAPQTELTYFVQGDDKVKIGKSVDPVRRLPELQTGSPVLLKLLAVTVTPEPILHARFAHSRAHGEWFYLSPDIQKYIEGLSK